MAGIGLSVDFGRALLLSSALQTAVDAAALAATSVAGGQNEKKSAADQIVLASLQVQPQTMMTLNPDGTVSYTATVDMPTLFSPFVTGSMTVTRAAAARATTVPSSGTPATPGSAARIDDSCIFSLGEDLEVTVDTMTFSGSPNAILTGCSLRSNKSIKCNGHDTGAQSYAVGSITGCSNPHPGEPHYPDIYAATAQNIALQCGAASNGHTWSMSGSLPAASPAVIHVARSGYSEIHICGNLTLSGSGTISSDDPAQDTVIVVENGGIHFARGAVVTARRTTFVIAAPASGVNAAPRFEFPNGGGNMATLNVTSSYGEDNPWRGLALYQSPSATANVDMTWKPGANVTLDGIAYFPNARLDLQGNISYGPKQCSKLVVGEFNLNGAVDLRQTAEGCNALKVKQYYLAPIAGSPGTPARAGSSAYLYR